MNLKDEKQKTIWKMSKKIKLPEPIDSEVSWARLESKLDVVDGKRSTITSLRQRPKLLQLKPALVVSFAVLMMILIPILYIQLNTVQLSTERGELLTHSLPDGSTISLSTESALKYSKFRWKSNREVEFNGEAYFDVEKGKSPFIIYSKGLQVEVLGTKFNIKNRDELIEVAVNEGEVQVTDTQSQSNIMLSAGQLSRFTRGELTQQPQELPFTNYPGWIENKLMFYQDNLANVCREISRRFDVQIQLSNQDLASILVTGVMESENIDSVLVTLTLLIQRDYRFEKGSYVIY